MVAFDVARLLEWVRRIWRGAVEGGKAKVPLRSSPWAASKSKSASSSLPTSWVVLKPVASSVCEVSPCPSREEMLLLDA
jgi:hypothetical protein